MIRLATIAFIGLALAACGSMGGPSNSRTNSIGSDTDDYKKSPCAALPPAGAPAVLLACGPLITVPNLHS